MKHQSLLPPLKDLLAEDISSLPYRPRQVRKTRKKEKIKGGGENYVSVCEHKHGKSVHDKSQY